MKTIIRMQASAWLTALSVSCALWMSAVASASILPPNSLDQEDFSFLAPGLTEAEFNSIIDSTVAELMPMAALHGAEFVVTKKWLSREVNAGAGKIPGSNRWHLIFYGGLARRPEMTPDAYTVAVCHELGHLFGGFPMYPSERGFEVAGEGQADYFATQVCLKRLWGSDPARNGASVEGLSVSSKRACDDVYPTLDERALCYRITQASLPIAQVLQSADEREAASAPVSLESADPSIANHTNVDYPLVQCRLDTFRQGALCRAEFDLRVIPITESAAARSSCMRASGYNVGLRPACWFRESGE